MPCTLPCTVTLSLPKRPCTVTLSEPVLTKEGPKRYHTPRPDQWQAHTKHVHVSIAIRRAQRDSSEAVNKYSVPEHSLPHCPAERACPDEGRIEALQHSPPMSR